MSKTKTPTVNVDMPDEIDFSNSMPNTYATRYAEGTNVILLDPDILDVFPDSESVNAALRPLAEIIRARLSQKQ